MNITKPMNASEVFDARLYLKRMYPEESRSPLWLEAALVDEQHRRDLAWFVSLLRERVKAQEHDSGSDYGIDGDDLADELEAALKEGG